MNILVTGGSKGIGKELVDFLSENNLHKVFYTYNKTSPSKAKSNCFSIKVDFEKSQDVENFIGKLDELDIDVLINNYHTGYKQGHAHKIHSSDLKNGLASNIYPTINLTNELIAKFRKKKTGTIITILTAAIDNFPTGCVQYIAEKRYLSAFVDAWKNENSAFGINSVAIYPEFTNTDIHKNLPDFVRNTLNQKNAIQNVLKEVLNVI
jgi:acetoacetyl-CoA reductase